MSRLYLLKYRIQNNDVNLKNKIRIVFFILIIFTLIPLFYFTNPFNKLKSILEKKEIEILSYKNITKEKNIGNDISSNSNITLPISGVITSGYGLRTDPISGTYSKHTGIDISGLHHDTVRSIDNGIVTYTGSQSGYGNCIEIKHDNYYSFYAHLSKIKVSQGQSINKGDVIGIEGGDPYSDPNPGYSTGHHLHFEIRNTSGYGHDINPSGYINKKL